jgi:hypothetical protein
MIEPIGSLSVDVIPQAVIGLPIAEVIGHHADISSGNDDFDYFEGASFKLDNTIEIAVRHYRGHPANTATLYIDRSARDVEQITMLIRRVLFEFDIPDTALTWERRINPEL